VSCFAGNERTLLAQQYGRFRADNSDHTGVMVERTAPDPVCYDSESEARQLMVWWETQWRGSIGKTWVIMMSSELG
jgi:hypothetical protein